jgi:hypothetical protein
LVADCPGLVVDGLGWLKLVQAWLWMVWLGCRLFRLDCLWFGLVDDGSGLVVYGFGWLLTGRACLLMVWVGSRWIGLVVHCAGIVVDSLASCWL